MTEKLPKNIENKIVAYKRAQDKALELHIEFVELLEREGVPFENLVANANNGTPQTEALTELDFCSIDRIGDIISQIEEVYSFFKKSGTQP